MKKNVKILVAFLFVILIIIGLWLLNSLSKQEQSDAIESPSFLANITLDAKSINVNPGVFPSWLNNREFVFLGKREIISYNVLTQEQKTLAKLDTEIKSLIVKENVIVAELGLPFTNIKGYRVYEIKENTSFQDVNFVDLDLKEYEPIVAFSLTNDSKRIRFIGKYETKKNSGNLYSYNVDTGLFEGEIYKNIPYSSIQWMNDTEALVYKFVENEEGETLFLLDSNKKTLTQIKPTLSEFISISLSPDKTHLLLSGGNGLLVKDLNNLTIGEKFKERAYVGMWLDNQNILATPKTNLTFTILNVNTKEEKSTETPKLIQNKTIRTHLPSPDNKHILIRTTDNVWVLIEIKS